jgi:Low-density lipoprotein receptor domain class A
MEIRQGLTSQSPLLETLTSDRQMVSEYLVPADIGFYIRLRGRLSHSFKLAIAYAAFSYAECYNIRDFVCLNHRCIDTSLRCDGFDHCGDNSDEQTACAKSKFIEENDTLMANKFLMFVLFRMKLPSRPKIRLGGSRTHPNTISPKRAISPK